MEPVFFVMAIMGCADGPSGCTQARVEPSHYTTIQQCRAAMPAALTRNTDVDYPVVTAACQRTGMQVAARDGAVIPVAR